MCLAPNVRFLFLAKLIFCFLYFSVKAQNEEAEKIQSEKEEKAKIDKTTEPSTPKKIQHPTWLRKKEYKKYIRSYRKQQTINAKRLKKSAKK